MRGRPKGATNKGSIPDILSRLTSGASIFIPHEKAETFMGTVEAHKFRGHVPDDIQYQKGRLVVGDELLTGLFFTKPKED